MKNRIVKNLLILLLWVLVILVIGYIFHTFGVVMDATVAAEAVAK
jgi:hypothetical protein